jgi:hypothetical protein
MARVLAAHNLISRDHKEVSRVLNSFIDQTWKMFDTMHPHTNKPRAFAGIDDEEWHIETVKRALKIHAPTYILTKMKIDNGASMDLLQNRMNGKGPNFIVDGTLNTQFLRVGRIFTKTGVLHEHPHSGGGVGARSWRHVIAVRGNRMICDGVGTTGVTLANLWLDDTGKPKENAYMKRFLKIYRIDKSDPDIVANRTVEEVAQLRLGRVR